MQITWVYNSHYLDVMNQPVFKDMMMSSVAWNGFEVIIKGNLKKGIMLFDLKYLYSLPPGRRTFSLTIKTAYLSSNPVIER